jgi:hypothetical protein
MTKYWLAGAAAFALTTGAALAQSTLSDSSTTVTTTTPAPVVNTYNTTKSQKTVDANGTEIDKSQTYSSGAAGTHATANSQTTSPDGTAVSTTHQERTVAPLGDSTTTTNQSTTTTPGR